MRKLESDSNRRAFLASGLKVAAAAAATCAFSRIAVAQTQASAPVSLFDGSTLNGWIQLQNSAFSVGTSDIVDLPGLAAKIINSSDPVSEFLNEDLGLATKESLSAFLAAGTQAAAAPAPAAGAPAMAPSAANPLARAAASALAKNLAVVVAGNLIYNKARFQNVTLRPETQQLLSHFPQSSNLTLLNRMLLEDAYPEELLKGVDSGWIVKDGAMASIGAARGVIYTANDYGRFRLIFTMRHVSGKPDHAACVLIFCTRPTADAPPQDALAGIQFQVPTGGHWDYRAEKNNDGGAEYTALTKSTCDEHQWSRVEILADASTGTARMAVAQPPGSKAVEILDFNDPTAGRIGPIALQIHNGGLFDEYKDITIEVNPSLNDLITTK
jgi:hypothetical protein